MKSIISLIVPLVAANAALAAVSKATKLNYYNMCLNALQPYRECVPQWVDRTYNQVESDCKIYLSDKCQRFFSNPFNAVPGCNDWRNWASGNYPIPMLSNLNIKTAIYTMICSRGNDGKLCPITEAYALDLNLNKEPDLILDNCGHQTCHRNYVRVLNYEIEMANNENSRNYFINIAKVINSDECQDKYNGVKKTTTTTTIKKITTTTTTRTTTTVVPKPVPTTTTVVPKPVPTTTIVIPKPVPTTTTVIPKPVPTTTTAVPKPVPNTTTVNDELEQPTEIPTFLGEDSSSEPEEPENPFDLQEQEDSCEEIENIPNDQPAPEESNENPNDMPIFVPPTSEDSDKEEPESVSIPEELDSNADVTEPQETTQEESESENPKPKRKCVVRN